ncbi:unnamed protein product [Rotaria socialis]|uniref:Uncharacterized protein n=2 Tax=Rotaria socialis TaxID=392032 RepID=A0A817VNE8_9BILA|nr:unnamed protein product [Rotaria socialis]
MIFIILGRPLTICDATVPTTTTLLCLSEVCEFDYQLYTFTYVTRNGSNSSLLRFNFRHDSMFWALDGVQVIDSVSFAPVIANGGFETINSNESWTVCNPSNSCFPGEISSNYSRTGQYSYLDGAMNNPDYLVQLFPTVSGRLYFVSFWLKNLGSGVNNATITIGS